jgi:hypothetical protein
MHARDPAFIFPILAFFKLIVTTTIVSVCHKLQHCKIAKNTPPNKSLIRGMSYRIGPAKEVVGRIICSYEVSKCM